MFVLLAYAGSVLLSVTQTSLCKAGGNKGDRDIFNVNKTVGATIMFVLMGAIFSMSFHLPTFYYSLAYAFFLTISMWAGLNAFSSGPLALTSMIISFSLIIPCFYGIFALKESISIFGIIGLILILCSIIIINSKKQIDKKASVKWLIFTLITMCSDGCASVVKKLHQVAFPGEYLVEYMLYSMSMVALVFIIVMLAKHKPQKPKDLLDVKGILSGVANGGSCFISLYIASKENLTVMSPLIAVLTMLASLSTGRILFKEKLTRNQIIGFIIGVISIVLLKL